MNAGIVYVIELSRPMSHARYYVGFAESERTYFQRIKQHVRGQGSAFTRAAVRAGIKMRVVLIIPNATRHDERRIKRQHNTARVVKTLRSRGFGASL